MIWQRLIFCLAIVASSSAVSAQEHRLISPDWAPFKKHQALYEEFHRLKFKSEGRSPQHFARRFEALKQAIAMERDWVDGLWMFGEEGILYAETFAEEQDLPRARKIYVDVKAKQETCLTMYPGHPICSFYLAVSMGQIGSIDGFLTGIRYAKKIQDLFQFVHNSGYDYIYPEGYTLQHSVKIALGVFNRMVPDSYLLELILGVRGNLERSIDLHRQVFTQAKRRSICNEVFLSVALICAADEKTDHPYMKEATTILSDIANQHANHALENRCAYDSKRILQDPSLACGYTVTKQHNIKEFEVAH